MISDSARQGWDYIVVWKLDRFARNRQDSALYKMRLRKNGVQVKSATETISDNPEGIILESVLEGIAEYYSADLSLKIRRGMRESALKGNSVGGLIPLGYKLENHKLVINPETAYIVQEAFQRYASGESIIEICRTFNDRGYRTAKNSAFNKSSFKSMFKNVRYVGTYIYKDMEMENTIPPIIDKDLFEAVQKRLEKTADAPARGKAKVDYLLSGKLFCGHCGSSMDGETGTSKTGAIPYTLTVNNLRIPVPAAGRNELEYNGQEQTYLPNGLDPTYCEIISNTATNVIAGGSWNMAAVSLKDQNVKWDDDGPNTREYPFRITLKPVTVTMLDKQITAGQPAPALASADCSITGLIGNDSFSVSLHYADPAGLTTVVTPDTGKAGAYAIVATYDGTRSINYAPTFVHGTLTIANRPSSGIGSVTCPVNLPGQTEKGSVSSSVKSVFKGSTVTITVRPEDGFRLDDLTDTDKDGNALELTDQGNGKYTFVMPASKVEIRAIFAAEVETRPFRDVEAGAYYAEAVQWAADNRIAYGIGGNLFGSDNVCTRARIVTFLWRLYAGKQSTRLTSPHSTAPPATEPWPGVFFRMPHRTGPVRIRLA